MRMVQPVQKQREAKKPDKRKSRDHAAFGVPNLTPKLGLKAMH
jgi:hypothetical protein